MSKINKGVYVDEYERNGVAWVHVKYLDHKTEIIITKEEWMRNGNR